GLTGAGDLLLAAVVQVHGARSVHAGGVLDQRVVRAGEDALGRHADLGAAGGAGPAGADAAAVARRQEGGRAVDGHVEAQRAARVRGVDRVTAREVGSELALDALEAGLAAQRFHAVADR